MKKVHLVAGAIAAIFLTAISYLLNTGQIGLPMLLARIVFLIESPAGLLAGIISGNLHQPNEVVAYILTALTYFGLYLLVALVWRRLSKK